MHNRLITSKKLLISSKEINKRLKMELSTPVRTENMVILIHQDTSSPFMLVKSVKRMAQKLHLKVDVSNLSSSHTNKLKIWTKLSSLLKPMDPNSSSAMIGSSSLLPPSSMLKTLMLVATMKLHSKTWMRTLKLT